MVMDFKSDFWIDELQRIGKVGVFNYNIRNGIVASSEVVHELFGISPKDAVDKESWLNLIHPSQRDELKLYFREKIKTGEDFDREFRLLSENDESERWIEIRGKVFFDEKHMPESISGTIHDVTELKKSEKKYKKLYIEFQEKEALLAELKEADRIKTEFFTNISHELRTPINVIFSAIQMQELMIENCSCKNGLEDKLKYINMMKQNCYRLLRLIENLIDITKFDNGYFSINESNQDIVSLIENVVLSVADYIENKDISIVFDTDIEEKIIACDAEKIERIILNLLSNAVKFTSSGGSIKVEVEDCGSKICIRVKDTGKGIPKNKLSAIFERFVQVEKSFTRDYEGSGIGLSIVKSLVEQHRGKIYVISKEGQGTEFIIYIPCRFATSEVCFESIGDNQVNKSSIERINMEFADI